MVRPAGTRSRKLAGLASELDRCETPRQLGALGDRLKIDTADALSDLIEADFECRGLYGETPGLDRYIEAFPILREMVDALDTAIDLVLRSRIAAGKSPFDALAELRAEHPDLAQQITDAFDLTQGLWSTNWVNGEVRRARETNRPASLGWRPDAGEPRYELKDFIGSGSYGDVYMAIDRSLSDNEYEALVAAKLLHSERLDLDESPDWQIEATRARRIDHPCVVKALDSGTTGEGTPYLIFEYVRGTTLHRKMVEQDTRMGARDVASIIASVADGVHAAHRAGVIHCDLSPLNVLIEDRTGTPKITDFGVADLLSADRPAGDETRRAGNLAFMSPEQFRGDFGAISTATDVYALGGILFYLLTGHLPNGSTLAEVSANHQAESGRTAPPRVRDLDRSIDKDLAAICERALHPDPDRRHQSAAEMAGDLRDWLERRPIRWTHPGPIRRTSLFMRRRPWAFSGLVGLTLLVVGLVAMTMAYVSVQSENTGLENARRLLIERINRGVREAKDEHNILDIHSALHAIDTWRRDSAYAALFDIGDFEGTHLDLVRQMYEGCLDTYGPDDIYTLVWESAYAHFAVVYDHPAPEAVELLRRNRDSWAALAGEDATWVRHTDLLIDCARVKEWWFDRAGSESPLPESIGDDAGAIAARLESFRDELSAWEDHNFMDEIAVRTLARVYSPRILDVPDKAEHYAELHKTFRR